MKLSKPLEQIIHFPRIENELDIFITCFRESIMMALINNGIEKFSLAAYNLIKGSKEDDLLYGLYLTDFSSKTEISHWNDQVAIISRFLSCFPGLIDEFHIEWQEGERSEIETEVDRGRFVVVDTRKLGGLESHAVCVGGYDNEDFLLFDPNGDYTKSYAKGSSGKGIKIPKKSRHLTNKVTGKTGHYRYMKIILG